MRIHDNVISYMYWRHWPVDASFAFYYYSGTKTLHLGWSICSAADSFNRAKGRMVAGGRLYKHALQIDLTNVDPSHFDGDTLVGDKEFFFKLFMDTLRAEKINSKPCLPRKAARSFDFWNREFVESQMMFH